MKALALALAALCATAPACKPAQSTTPTTPLVDPKPDAPAGGMGFTLVELKLFINDQVQLRIHADGTVEGLTSDEGQPETWAAIAKISADGKLLDAGGKEKGALQADGGFKFANGDTPFKFEGAEFVAGERHITIDDKGVVQGADANGVTIRFEGLTDDGSRRTALFSFAIASMIAAQQSNAGGAPPAPPAP